MACCFLLLWNSIHQSTLSNAQKAAHLWGISGYYMYLPGVIHQDIKSLSFKSQIIEEYGFSAEVFQAFQHKKSQNQVIQYPIGMAIVYTPFFVIGHLIAVVGDYPKDGFSIPYQAAIYWGSVFVSMLGLWFCRNNLLKYFEDKTTAVTLIAILFGTNYFTYATIYPEMPHNYLFTLYSILIAATIKWHEQPEFRSGTAIGACIGLASLVWVTEVIGLIIPLIWGIGYFKDVVPQLQRLIFHFRKVLLAVFVGFVIGGLQLTYWKYVTDKFVINYYVTNAINWWHEPKQIMLKYWWIWISQNPILLFALIGFYFLWRQQRAIFWASLIYCAVQLYIGSTWNIWGSNHYSRQAATIHMYPILIFPLASFLNVAFARRWSATLALLFVVAAIVYNFTSF